MSLATRCPTCGTVFRVVHDQLLVSEGWVRCGRCAGVFNAADDLLDIATGRPVQLPLPAGAAQAARRATPHPAAATPDLDDRWEADAPGAAAPLQQPPSASTHAAQPPVPAPDAQPDPLPAPWPEAQAEALAAQQPATEPAQPDAAAPAAVAPEPESTALLLRSASPEPEPESAAVADVSAGAPSQAHTDSAAASAHGGLSATLADPDHAAAPALAAMAAFPQEVPPPAEPAPEFVRAADRAAQWRRPPVRAGALAAAMGLGALALAQAALLWRDPLAAHHPGWAAPLQALCRVAGCQVQPLHRIEQLSVDASGLSRVDTPAAADDAASAVLASGPASGPTYRLNLTLRNRAETALAVPAVELSLTDSSGQLVLRKALRLAELGAQQAVIAAGQELSLQALLAVGDRRIDGYTVELFYP